MALCMFLIIGIVFYTQAQKIQTTKGVEIIQNGKKPKPPKDMASKVRFELECVFGESDDPEKSFSEVSTFVVDDNEILYALDFKDRKIKVFDDKGQFVRSFGEHGQGPGELEMPAGIHLTPSNELLVEDALARKLVYFTKEGSYIKHVSFVERMILVNLLMGPKGSFIGRELKLEGEKMFFEIKMLDSELKSLFSLDKIGFPIPVPGSGNKINLEEVLTIYQFDSSGRIYYGHNRDYEINVYAPEGKHVKSIQKVYDPQNITEEDIDEILDRMGNMMGGINPKDVFEFPKVFPPYQSFTLDEDGRIFVRTWNKGKNKGEFVIDVFDSEGRFIAQIVSKMDFRLWKKGKVYSYEENEEGFNIIKRYNVLWEH